MLLVVEDNPHFSATIKTILEKRGYSFDIVDTGSEAVARLINQGERYALAIIDARLPDRQGGDIIRTVRSIDDPDKALVPIVMMTGGDPIPDDLIRDGKICGVLYKPFLVSDLMRMIKQCSRWEPESDPEASTDLDGVVLADAQSGD